MVHAGEVVADRFEVVALAGSGGMSTVYRANDRLAGGVVALKLLGGADEDAASRFSREARLLGELGHPAIVHYIAHGLLGTGMRWLAMEWIDGENLARRLGRGPLSVSESLALARRVAAALAVAHSRGVVHRDIKPSNLMLVGGRIDGVKVIDFGVARLVQRADVTRTGDRVGTPRYMAPEQARGEPDVDARADVFSLGCVLYACLTGRTPFIDDDPTEPRQAGSQTGPPPPSRLATVPTGVDELVLRMLAVARADRPADGAALVEEIVRLTQTDETRGVAHDTTLGGGERRLVSVIVCPRPRAELAALAARSGGTVASTEDGASVVTLGGYGVATDRAAHAARVALAVHTLAGDVAVGLATGWAYLGASAPAGEATERAAALARSSPPGVWLDDVTAGLLDNRFQLVGSEARLELRGELRGDTVRKLLGRPSPFVGRERELATLEAAFAGCLEGQATAVLVTGLAGAGKSRLRYELALRIGDRAQIFMGRGDPLRAGSPFGLLAAAVRELTGILDDEPLEVARRRLGERVAAAVPAGDARRVTEFLGELVGVPFPALESVQLRAARDDRALMGDQIHQAWEDFLRALAARQPVALVLEDLHWGDVPSVQLVDRALANLADQPLLVLALARPEVHDLFPRLWAGRGVTEIALPPLPRKAGERLVAQVLGARATPAVIEAITERAGGNAFFLEELIRGVAESAADMPRTLVAMVLARVEALPAEARRVLRAASIFGEVFWRGGVAALAGEEATAWVQLLAERELIGRRASRRLQTEEEYVFRHALVREAAYGTLTDEDRRAGHRAAAIWLEAAGERDSAVLARHFERGGEPARAVLHYTRAAEQALEGNDLEAVLRLVASGAGCGAAGPALGRLRLLEAQAHAWRTEFAATVEAARAAARLDEPGSAPWLGAIAEAAVACARTGRLEEAFALADELCVHATADAAAHRALARVASMLALVGAGDRVQRLLERLPAPESCDDPQLAGFLHRACREGNEHPAAIAPLEKAVECFLAAGDVRSATLDRANIGLILTRIGAWERAERLLREVLATANRLGLTMVQTDARFALAGALAGRGAVDEAVPLFVEAIARYVKNGARRMEASARCGLARQLARRGRRDEAAAEARQAVAAAAEMPPSQAFALATLAHVEEAGAAATAMAAWDAYRRAGAAEDEVWTLVVVARALAGVDDAVAAAATSAARARARSWLALLDGELRAALLAREELVWLLAVS